MLSFDYAPALLKGIVDKELKRQILGRPADAIRGAYQRNRAATEYIGQEGVAMWGIAAVDVALWDLLARRLGIPAAVLFGQHAKAVPVYGSGGWLSYTDEQLADEVARYLARGFAGVKLKVGGDEDRDVERVHAVRRAVGPRCKLMVDANQVVSLEKAARLARRLEDCHVDWFEEPFPKQDIESYVQLAKRTEIPWLQVSVNSACRIPAVGCCSGYFCRPARPASRGRSHRLGDWLRHWRKSTCCGSLRTSTANMICTWPLRSPTPLPSNPLIGWILFGNSSLKFATDSLMFPIDRDSV